VRAIAAAAGRVAVLYETGSQLKIELFDASTATLLATTNVSGSPDERVRLTFDGQYMYVRSHVDTGTSVRIAKYAVTPLPPGFTTGESSAIWSTDLENMTTPAIEETKVAMDDRYVYTYDQSALYMIDKRDGAIVWATDLTSTGNATALAYDGRYLWSNVQIGQANPYYLTAFHTRQEPGLYQVQSGATRDRINPLRAVSLRSAP
jgi:hypothetical protein